MKPLLKKELPDFLKRFDSFIDGEIRHVEIISPTVIKVTLAGQDSARGFDWITVEFEFGGVSDARLLDDSKLSFADMSEAISLINEDDSFAFGLGRYSSLSGVKNSSFYIISDTLKYQEGTF